MTYKSIYRMLKEYNDLLPFVYDSFIVNGSCDNSPCSCRETLKKAGNLEQFLQESIDCYGKAKNNALSNLMSNPVVMTAANNYVNAGIKKRKKPITAKTKDTITAQLASKQRHQ